MADGSGGMTSVFWPGRAVLGSPDVVRQAQPLCAFGDFAEDDDHEGGVAVRDGQPWFGVGASGGRRILGAVLQITSFIVDFGMDADAAAHHTRIDVNGSEHATALEHLLVEASTTVPALVFEVLRAVS